MSTLRIIKCDEPWWTLIKEGKKPLEGRKASPTWDIKVGEVVTFQDSKDEKRTFNARVTGINKYDPPNALDKFLIGETWERALPKNSTVKVENIDDARRVYLSYFTLEEIEKWGMLGIQITPV